ncbi:MAG: O-antigen ligase family protein, partial [Bdellovibrionales bacterium]|nr:O-antigen ligase family protein [Bdellovibrionales bacterium]
QTLAFGGVHMSMFGMSLFTFSTLFILSLLLSPSSPRSTLVDLLFGSRLRTAASCSFIFFCLALMTESVLFTGSFLSRGYSSYLASFFHFWIVFLLSLFFVSSTHKKAPSLLRMDYPLLLIGSCMACIGLSHALSDSGALFGLFYPEHIFRSHRARWPFVNANHYAHFLLPLFILSLGGALVRITFLQRSLISHTSPSGAKRQASPLRESFHSRETLHALRSCVLWASGSTIMLSGIFLSLSRSTWLILGTILFAIFCWRILKTNESKPDRHHKNKRAPLPFALRHLQTILMGVFLAILIILLLGKGSEHIASRITQTVSSTHEEIRLKLYHLTLNHFGDSPLIGIGASQWEAFFHRERSADLTGFEPEYLHSDPLQLLFECGLLGIAPFLFFGLFLLRETFTKMTDKSQSAHSQLLLGFTLMATLSLVGVSFFDFPFRIPALVSVFAIVLSHLIARVEPQEANLPKSHMNL